MIYEIDESCLETLYTNDSNSIAFLEQLALDRRKCKNIIVAKRQVFEELSQMPIFSQVTREVYRILGKRGSEHKLMLNQTKKYCQIVGEHEGNSVISENGKEIIVLKVSEGVSKDFTGKSLMLAENEEDISFYKILGQYYVQQKKWEILRLILNHEMVGEVQHILC